MLRRILAYRFRESFETAGVRVDVVAIHEIVLNQDMNHAVEQREVGPGLERQKKVCHHGRFGHAGIGDDERLGRIAIEPLAENGVVIGNVRAH